MIRFYKSKNYFMITSEVTPAKEKLVTCKLMGHPEPAPIFRTLILQIGWMDWGSEYHFEIFFPGFFKKWTIIKHWK